MIVAVKSAGRTIQMNLRNSEIEDARLLYEWENDSAVWIMAFSFEPIEREGHIKWFEKKLPKLSTDIHHFDNSSESLYIILNVSV